MLAYLFVIVAALIGYLFGSIPFGKLYVRFSTGKDLQQIGSGRTGGTNSMRAAGPIVGFTTAMSDVLKGILAVYVVRWLLASGVEASFLPWLEVSAGIFTVVGHNWSIFLGFGGGAGTGPNVGWASAIWGLMFPIAFAIMVAMIFLLGYASVASMTMALIIPAMFVWLYATGVIVTPAYIVGGIITSAIVAYSLRGNFARLIRGEERIVGLRAQLRRKREAEAQA